jgi:predicted nucleic acid-binding protein
MNIADTSFLFSLYGRDTNTPAAIAWVVAQNKRLCTGTLGHYELANALRFAAFRKAISPLDAAHSLAAIESDIKTGHLGIVRPDLAQIVAEAACLSALHTQAGGHRAFDILHVSTARLAKARMFLSFDNNQRKLAASTGLAVGP